MKFVVGLGNPDKKYKHTRHNIGLEVIRWFDGSDPEIRLPEGIELLVPADDGIYMNHCGPWIAEKVRYKNAGPNDVLIVCDDFMLPYGQLRIRTKGSSGGHNGLQSIFDA